MAKKFLQRFLPDPHTLRKHKSLKIFGDKLTNPNLWHISRRSVPKAFAIGLFISYLPIPGHTVYAALLSIFWRANLPIAVALVWIVANPFAMGPMYYLGYKLGAILMRTPPVHFDFQISFRWIFHELGAIAIPLLLGCVICGIGLALLGYVGIQLFWRWNVIRMWHKRQAKRQPT